MYYDECQKYTQKQYGDIVCVVKKKTKLARESSEIQKIQSEINYLFEKKL
jgi:hypothetical protein